ncbi:hypothetical protein RJP69_26380, partial [Escherichia coli]|uniref:hypothetical protein n=1 Tax=Escherichia coli TaxID=562 RepID=UPI002875717E
SRGGGIGKTEIYINDKIAVADARDAKLRQNPHVAREATVALTVDLPASSFVKGAENQIRIVTSNFLKEIGKGNIQSRSTAISFVNREKENFQLPSLYAVVGGVSDYEGDQLDLRFAAKDAEDFSNALGLGARKLFCAVEKPDCLDKVSIET